MELHNEEEKFKGCDSEENVAAYEYVQHRVGTYDPTLSSAARYSPPYSSAVTETASTEFTNITYGNVILIPNSGFNETQQGIVEVDLDQSQAYILSSSDPRLFNTYIRGSNEINPATNSNNYNEVINTHADEHIHGQHIIGSSSNDFHNLQLIDNNPIYSSNITNEHNILEEKIPLTKQIILHQSTNSTKYIYAQIHNSYDNNTNSDGIELVTSMDNSNSTNAVGNEYVLHQHLPEYNNHLQHQQPQQQQQQQQQQQPQLIQQQLSHQRHQQQQQSQVQQQQQQYVHTPYAVENVKNEDCTNMIILPTVKDNTTVEMFVNTPYFKSNEYKIIEPANKLIIEQNSKEILCEYETNNTDDKMSEPQYIEMQSLNTEQMQQQQQQLQIEQQQRLLMESAMSPLLAAVNDITAREEQLQYYMSQNNDYNLYSNSNTTNSNINNNNITDISIGINNNNLNDINISNTTGSDNDCASDIDKDNCTKYTISKCKSSNNISESDNVNLNNNIITNSNNLKLINIPSASDEYVDINDMEFICGKPKINNLNDNQLIICGKNEENGLMRRSQRRLKLCNELMVVDKHVPSRAWASVPTSYVYIGKCSNNNSEHTIFSKREIPKQTKFGPMEGDLNVVNSSELSIYLHDTDDKYPKLIINGEKILNTSNEYTSNWMRFVHLAQDFIEQNLLIYEFDEKLYFKSCQIINAKQELKVGYSSEYAAKYNLKCLYPNENEKLILYDKENTWPCYECDKKFNNSESFHSHLNEHEKKDENKNVLKSNKSMDQRQQRRRRKSGRTKLTTRKVSGPTVRYACCYCSKIFLKFNSYKRHTDFVHSVHLARNGGNDMENNRCNANRDGFKCTLCPKYFTTIERLMKHRLAHCSTIESKPVKCLHCPKRFLTPSAMALHAKIHIYKNRYLLCPFCGESFSQSFDMLQHVKIHMENGFYNCQYCKKKFSEYKTIRKHIRAYHTAKKFSCPDCGKEFVAAYKLKIHQLRHSNVREFLCNDCGKQFKRKDKLHEHVVRMHSNERKLKELEKLKQKKLNKINKKKLTEKGSSWNVTCVKKTDNISAHRNIAIGNTINRLDNNNNHNNNNTDNNIINKNCNNNKRDNINNNIDNDRYNNNDNADNDSDSNCNFHNNNNPNNNNNNAENNDDKNYDNDKNNNNGDDHYINRNNNNNNHKNNNNDVLNDYFDDNNNNNNNNNENVDNDVTDGTTDIVIESDNFQSKVTSTDYENFVYKCKDCLLGFKRRGMLVNHLAKRHPNIVIDSVPELKLPILKEQRYYLCQYCDKVYKSSSKRKAHILKYHPGCDLPLSSRKNIVRKLSEMDVGVANSTFTHTVGSVTTEPHRCTWCHKQYASKTRLVQHQRNQHIQHLAETSQTEFKHINHPDEIYQQYKIENIKLLKLSTEVSVEQDFCYINDKLTINNAQQSDEKDVNAENNSLSDDGITMATDYNDVTVAGGLTNKNMKSINNVRNRNAELNPLPPQLFDDIDLLNLKPITSINTEIVVTSKNATWPFDSGPRTII